MQSIPANMLVSLSELVYANAWILDMRDHSLYLLVVFLFFFFRNTDKKFLLSVSPLM